MKKALSVFGLSFLLASAAMAQTQDCQQALLLANDEFNAGRFYGIPALLSDCLDKFTNEQKVQAYHLLAQCYLIIDDPIAAEDSYLKLLRADPEYIADPEKDPIDIVYLSEKFTATPIFTPHLRLGGNLPFYRTIYEITTEPYGVDRKFAPKLGFQVAGSVDWNINDNLSLCGELDYSFRNFKNIRTGLSNNDVQNVVERQSWLDVPFYLKYKDDKGRYRPYGYVGYSLNLLLNASAELSTDNKSTNPEAGVLQTQGPNENITYKRNLINRSLVIGGGVYYKIGHDFLFVDLRYSLGFTNLAKPDKVYYAQDGSSVASTIPRYRWIGDYFRQDFLSLSFGYVRPIYNPRKLKRARSKNVLKSVDD